MHDVSNLPLNADARWRSHIAEQRRGGLSVRDYCAAHGLAAPTFYERRRRLEARPAFVPVHVTRPPAPPLEESAGVELLLASGHRLRLARGFDQDVLRAAVGALTEVRPC